jgi:hypothetical protein
MAKQTDPDVGKVLRNARALEKKIAAYAADGGTIETANKTEMQLFRARDKLEDSLRPLGLGDNVECLAAIERVRAAVRAAPEAARAVRLAGYERESKRLREQEREHNAGLGGFEKELRLMRNGRIGRLR